MKLLKLKGAGKIRWEVPMAAFPEVARAVMEWARRPRPYTSFAVEEDISACDWVTEPLDDARIQLMQVRLKGTSALSFLAELQQARPKKVRAACPALPVRTC